MHVFAFSYFKFKNNEVRLLRFPIADTKWCAPSVDILISLHLLRTELVISVFDWTLAKSVNLCNLKFKLNELREVKVVIAMIRCCTPLSDNLFFLWCGQKCCIKIDSDMHLHQSFLLTLDSILKKWDWWVIPWLRQVAASLRLLCLNHCIYHWKK